MKGVRGDKGGGEKLSISSDEVACVAAECLQGDLSPLASVVRGADKLQLWVWCFRRGHADRASTVGVQYSRVQLAAVSVEESIAMVCIDHVATCAKQIHEREMTLWVNPEGCEADTEDGAPFDLVVWIAVRPEPSDE